MSALGCASRPHCILSSVIRCLSFSSVHHAVNISTIQMSYDEFKSSSPAADLGSANNPLVVMHGLFGSKQNWRGVSKALAAKTNRQIYTVDARNHGNSSHTNEHTSTHMAADVREFLQMRNINKGCLMGHSMGGRTMMHFALKYPNLMDRLIVVDISPIIIPRDFYEMDKIFQAMLNINVPPELSMAEGRKVAKDQIKDAVDSNETVEFILLNLRKNQNGEFYWAANVKTIREELKRFDEFEQHIIGYQPFAGPTMFICGNKSNFVNPDHVPQIRSYFPKAEFHWLDAGHLVHFEQPEKFINLVVKFLKN